MASSTVSLLLLISEGFQDYCVAFFFLDLVSSFKWKLKLVQTTVHTGLDAGGRAELEIVEGLEFCLLRLSFFPYGLILCCLQAIFGVSVSVE